jgi:GAF domain-containing protein
MATEDVLGAYFDALYQIVLRISSSLDLDAVLAYLTEETAQAVGAKAASVRLLDSTGQILEMRAVYNLSPAYLGKGPVILSRSPVDAEILSGKPTQLDDVRRESGFQYPEEAAREGIVSMASVPLIAKGRPIGVLRVYSGERRSYTDVQMRFLVAAGDIAALAIENARLYDQMRQKYEDTMNILWGDEPV